MDTEITLDWTVSKTAAVAPAEGIEPLMTAQLRMLEPDTELVANGRFVNFRSTAEMLDVAALLEREARAIMKALEEAISVGTDD